MLSCLLELTLPVALVALLYARWEYRSRGRLSLLGLFLLCAMLFVPNLVLHYASDYQAPSRPLEYFGLFIAALGLGLCLLAIVHFRSVAKVFCLDAGQLTQSGPYRRSRNPQYLGWVLFLLGFALYDWSSWSLAVLLLVAVSLHFLVLVEEEHLHRVFGQSYDEFCRQVPRYLGSKSLEKVTFSVL